LSRCDDGVVSLTELVHAELTAVGVRLGDERIVVDGPLVTLPFRVLQLLALALHELATNALKHDALKDASGRLDVRWQILDGSENTLLELAWVESGVEFYEQKSSSLHRGYGRELLEHGLPYQLDATTKFEPGADGMRFWLSVPLRNHEGQKP
jgi:two-component sensor histidine kinase